MKGDDPLVQSAPWSAGDMTELAVGMPRLAQLWLGRSEWLGADRRLWVVAALL